MSKASTTPVRKARKLPSIRETWRSIVWHLQQMAQQFLEHDCLAAAAALTYTTLFAVVPLMTVTYTFFSILPEYAQVGDQVRSFIFQNFVPGSSDVVQEKLVEFADRARNLTAVGFIFLFITSFLMLVTIEKSFNTIWHVPEPRRGLQRFLLYWGVLSLGPACVVAGMLSSLYLLGLPLVSDLDTFGIAEMVLSYLPVILSIAGFTVLYYAVPNCHVPFNHASISTVVIFGVGHHSLRRHFRAVFVAVHRGRNLPGTLTHQGHAYSADAARSPPGRPLHHRP